MKKTYSAPDVEICVFDNGDNTNTQILKSGGFGADRASGVGSNTYTNVFDY